MANKISDQRANSAQRAPTHTTRRTIACIICQALYAPAPEHSYLLYASPLVFESAFISMCRFCFRCRRPACPECWDHVHGVCGQCTLESQLPFRTEVAPLPGVFLMFPEREQAAVSPLIPERHFVCIYPGRFQSEAERATSELPTAPPRERKQTQKSVTAATQALPPLSIPLGLDIDDIITRPDRSSTFELATKPISTSQTQPEKQTHTKPVSISQTQPEKHTASIRSIIENIGINLLLLLLICILLLIIAAEVSPGINMLLFNLLHIDIRAEVTYLLKLINNLHF